MIDEQPYGYALESFGLPDMCDYTVPLLVNKDVTCRLIFEVPNTAEEGILRFDSTYADATPITLPGSPP